MPNNAVQKCHVFKLQEPNKFRTVLIATNHVSSEISAIVEDADVAESAAEPTEQTQVTSKNYLTLSNLANGNAVNARTWNAETTLQSSLNRLGGKSCGPKDRKPLSQLSPLYKAARRSKTNLKNRDVPVRRKRKTNQRQKPATAMIRVDISTKTNY